MANQKLKDHQTFPVTSDPRIGISPSTKGTPLPGTKANGKVFANQSAGEVSGPGQMQGKMNNVPKGPTMKGAPAKEPSEDKSSKKESTRW